MNNAVNPATSPPSVFRKIYPLAFVNTLGALATSMVNVLLPQIAREAHLDVSITQWATLAFLLSSTILIVPSGWLGDRIGKSRLLKISMAIFLIASILGTFAPNFAALVAARALQGAGVAAMLTTPMALVRQLVAPTEVGRAMGIMGSSMATGMALGPALGGLAAGTPLGWRGAFSLFIVLTLVGLYFIHRHLPDSPALSGSFRLDSVGMLFMLLGLTTYSIALTLKPGGTAGTGGLLALSALFLGAFVAQQLRTDSPLIDIAALKAAGLLPHLGLAFGAAIVMMTFTIIPPFYLTDGLGLHASAMGLVMAIGPIMAIMSGVPAGRFVDRIGASRMTILGLFVMTVAALSFVGLPALLPLGGFIISAMILTPGNQMFMAANNTRVMTEAPADMQGSVSGALNLARNLGFTTGTALMAAVYDTAISSEAGALCGLQSSFAVAATVGSAAVGVSIWLHHRGGKPQPTQSVGAPITTTNAQGRHPNRVSR